MISILKIVILNRNRVDNRFQIKIIRQVIESKKVVRLASKIIYSFYLLKFVSKLGVDE